jgi:hypothetical protein
MPNGLIENTYNPHQFKSADNAVDAKTIIAWAFKLLSVVAIPLLVWMISLLLSTDKRVAVMERNYLTANEGIELREDVTTIQRDMLGIIIDVDEISDCQVNIRLGTPENC